MVRRGTVFIAPTSQHVPDGRMVEPSTSVFWASWQDDGPLEDVELIGAEAAIAWGRERSDRVLIRLGHTEGTHYSAGHERLALLADGREPYPVWPPEAPPPEGWWVEPGV